MAGKYLKGKKPGRKKKGLSVLRMYAFFVLSFFVITIIFIIYNLDRRAMPAILAAADMNTKTVVNSAINDSLKNIIESDHLTSEDFYHKTESAEGKINSIGINTVLVNDICSEVAYSISAGLNGMGDQKITLPFGAVIGINAFANMGPKFSVSVMPIGEAQVDYSSSFESVGINQVNFQIWLDIEAKVKIINPVQDSEVIITRKVSLVNTVISGEVPPTYLNIDRN